MSIATPITSPMDPLLEPLDPDHAPRADRPLLAIVTGASSGIGLELARCCAADGCELIIAADDPALNEAAEQLRADGARAVSAVHCDLATAEGVAEVMARVDGRAVDLLFANAGHGLGHGFLDQAFDEVRHVIDTNITGTLDLIHRVGRQMRERGRGRILVTGSIAGFTPGSFQAAYNGSKAFIDSFTAALRNELEDTGVSVTCLMPGATDTQFFARADMLDTKVGQAEKDDPKEVARVGYRALMDGDDSVIVGWKNKMQVASGLLTPSSTKAAAHRKVSEPGSAD